MELRHLRYFVALTECLSFTRAADRVHITQSTLSHQIRQLEDESVSACSIGSASGSSRPKPASSSTRSRARALERGRPGHRDAASRAAAASTGQVRVGATHTFNIGLIPECVALFLARHPTVRVRVDELVRRRRSAQRLRAGELDIGIAYRPSRADRPAVRAALQREMVLVVSDAHPLARAQAHPHGRAAPAEAGAAAACYFATRTLLDECFKRERRRAGRGGRDVDDRADARPGAAHCQIGAIVATNAVPAGDDAGLSMIPIESPTPITHAGHPLARASARRRRGAVVRGDRAQDGARQQPAPRRPGLTAAPYRDAWQTRFAFRRERALLLGHYELLSWTRRRIGAKPLPASTSASSESRPRAPSPAACRSCSPTPTRST